ncbi:hypothetical protein [Streptomyces sp. NPDC050548]|uniref:hypothetical protein n=1 Tax=Streptomyces sp. NPDC050548 TaxID=3365629 RepID=UPI0037A3F803
MSLEPAIATAIGLRVLGQTPGPAPAAGIACVVVAGIGVTRTGSSRTATAAGTPPEAQPYVQEAS